MLSHMSAEDLYYAGIDDLGNEYRTKKLSPVDVVRALIERIERFNDKLGVYITVTADQALEAARQLEGELRRGVDRGPLHGIPYAVKDQMATKGIRTTAGSLLFKDWIPEENATVVSRMNSAGAILLGKLNMTELAWGAQLHYPYGLPRNPWNQAHDTGGSSNGSGSALAAGLATVTIGEDTGGSTRIPASYCGVSGLRPTWGIVSRHGVVPTVWQLDTLGPMARTVKDVAYTLQVIAGNDPLDPTTSSERVGIDVTSLPGDLKGMRIGIVKELMESPDLDREVRGATRQAASVLSALGAQIHDVSLPLVHQAGVAYIAFGEAEAAVSHFPYLRTRAAEYGYVTRVRLSTGLLIPGFIARWADRVACPAIRRQVLSTFESCDVLIAPTTRTTAPLHEKKQSIGHKTKEDALREFGLDRAYTMPFSLAGAPSLAVCSGFSEAGMPLSLQIVGKPFTDDLVLKVGHAYQGQTKWHSQRPNLG
jgi:aspartyl-tRNA(Asn)/glutamyl-tRNA(Gln) amidotransferase subunit A